MIDKLKMLESNATKHIEFIGNVLNATYTGLLLMKDSLKTIVYVVTDVIANDRQILDSALRAADKRAVVSKLAN